MKYRKEKIHWITFRTLFVLAETSLILILLKQLEVMTNNVSTISFIIFISFICTTIASLPIGKIINQKNNKKIMIMGEISRIIMLFAFIFIKDIHLIITTIIYIAMFLFTVLVTNASYSLLDDITKKHEKPKVLGTMHFLFGIVRTISSFICAYLLKNGSSIEVLTLITIIILGLSLIFAIKVRKRFEEKETFNKDEEKTFEIKKYPQFVYSLVTFGLFILVIRTMDLVHIDFAKIQLNLGVETLGFFASFFALGSIFSPIFISSFLANKKYFVIFQLPAIFLIFYLILMLFSVHFYILIATFTLVGFFFNLILTGSSIVSQQVKKEHVSQAVSYHIFVSSSTPILGLATVTGLLFFFDYIFVIYFLIIILIISSFYGFIYSPYTKKRP